MQQLHMENRKMLLFLTDGVTEMADKVAEREVLAMAVDEQTGIFQFEFSSLGIDIAGVGADIEDVGDKHVVTAEMGDALDPAFDTQR